MKERRETDRNMCAELLSVRWTDDEGHGRLDVASLEDISPKGACLHVEHSLPIGTKVVVHYPNGKYSGTVKYCKLQPNGYILGIAFDDGYRWSKADFEPAHLLELPPSFKIRE